MMHPNPAEALMIYASAIYATADESVVTGTDAEGNSETVPADYTIFRLDNDGPVAFVRNGGTIQPYVAPEPVPVPPHLNYGGLVRFTGPAPSAVLEAVRVIGASRVVKGRYRALHESAMPSDQYSAIVCVLDSRPLIARITARTVDYIEVRVTDLAGVAQDPTEVTIKTERVIYS